MSTEESSRQAHPFEFYLTEDEYRLFARAAKAWNCSIQDFFLDAALEKAIAVTEEDVSSHLATVTSDELNPALEPAPQTQTLGSAPAKNSSMV